MKKITVVLLAAILLIAMAFTLTACDTELTECNTECDTEWDQAMKNAVKDFSSGNNSANYKMDYTYAYEYGTENERSYPETVLVGGGKYKEGDGEAKFGSYPLLREDYGNDALTQGMLIGSMIGKEAYFAVENSKYTLLDDKKAAIVARLDELRINFDIVTEMYYVINDGRITEYYAIFDRSSGAMTSPNPPMLIHITFEYGNVSL